MELSHIYRIAYVPSDYAYLKLLVLLTSLLVVCVTAIEKGIHYDHHPLCPMENRLNLRRDVPEPVHFKITGRIPVHMIYTTCTLIASENGLDYSKHAPYIRCSPILSKRH